MIQMMDLSTLTLRMYLTMGEIVMGLISHILISTLLIPHHHPLLKEPTLAQRRLARNPPAADWRESQYKLKNSEQSDILRALAKGRNPDSALKIFLS